MNRVWKFCRNHGLSLALTALYLTFMTASFVLPEGPVQAMVSGHTDGIGTLLLAVILKRFLWEKGSPEAEDPPPDPADQDDNGI